MVLVLLALVLQLLVGTSAKKDVVDNSALNAVDPQWKQRLVNAESIGTCLPVHLRQVSGPGTEQALWQVGASAEVIPGFAPKFPGERCGVTALSQTVEGVSMGGYSDGGKEVKKTTLSPLHWELCPVTLRWWGQRDGGDANGTPKWRWSSGYMRSKANWQQFIGAECVLLLGLAHVRQKVLSFHVDKGVNWNPDTRVISLPSGSKTGVAPFEDHVLGALPSDTPAAAKVLLDAFLNVHFCYPRSRLAQKLARANTQITTLTTNTNKLTSTNDILIKKHRVCMAGSVRKNTEITTLKSALATAKRRTATVEKKLEEAERQLNELDGARQQGDDDGGDQQGDEREEGEEGGDGDGDGQGGDVDVAGPRNIHMGPVSPRSNLRKIIHFPASTVAFRSAVAGLGSDANQRFFLLKFGETALLPKAKLLLLRNLVQLLARKPFNMLVRKNQLKRAKLVRPLLHLFAQGGKEAGGVVATVAADNTKRDMIVNLLNLALKNDDVFCRALTETTQLQVTATNTMTQIHVATSAADSAWDVARLLSRPLWGPFGVQLFASSHKRRAALIGMRGNMESSFVDAPGLGGRIGVVVSLDAYVRPVLEGEHNMNAMPRGNDGSMEPPFLEKKRDTRCVFMYHNGVPTDDDAAATSENMIGADESRLIADKLRPTETEAAAVVAAPLANAVCSILRNCPIPRSPGQVFTSADAANLFLRKLGPADEFNRAGRFVVPRRRKGAPWNNRISVYICLEREADRALMVTPTALVTLRSKGWSVQDRHSTVHGSKNTDAFNMYRAVNARRTHGGNGVQLQYGWPMVGAEHAGQTVNTLLLYNGEDSRAHVLSHTLAKWHPMQIELEPTPQTILFDLCRPRSMAEIAKAISDANDVNAVASVIPHGENERQSMCYLKVETFIAAAVRMNAAEFGRQLVRFKNTRMMVVVASAGGLEERSWYVRARFRKGVYANDAYQAINIEIKARETAADGNVDYDALQMDAVQHMAVDNDVHRDLNEACLWPYMYQHVNYVESAGVATNTKERAGLAVCGCHVPDLKHAHDFAGVGDGKSRYAISLGYLVKFT